MAQTVYEYDEDEVRALLQLNTDYFCPKVGETVDEIQGTVDEIQGTVDEKQATVYDAFAAYDRHFEEIGTIEK